MERSYRPTSSIIRDADTAVAEANRRYLEKADNRGPKSKDVYESDVDEETGTLMTCIDCGRHIFYDYMDEQYHHSTEPERGCFLIPAEEVPDWGKCPNGHNVRINNEVTGELWCPLCKWQGYPDEIAVESS